jgi:hypothetical protein
MRKLLERGEQAARAGQRRAIGEIAARMREQLGGGIVEEQVSAIVIKGRQLMRRWLNEPALRFIAGGRR